MVIEDVERIIATIPTRFPDVEVLRQMTHRDHSGVSIRVVIDRDGGVDTMLCEAVSNHISRALDLLTPAIRYCVEVESAGVERPLLKPEHYMRFVGRGARVITRLRIGNRTEFSGAIASAADDSFIVADPHAGLVEIPYAAVKRAHLTYEFRDDLRRR